MKAELKARRVVNVVVLHGDAFSSQWREGSMVGFGKFRVLGATVVHPAGVHRGWARMERFLMN